MSRKLTFTDIYLRICSAFPIALCCLQLPVSLISQNGYLSGSKIGHDRMRHLEKQKQATGGGGERGKRWGGLAYIAKGEVKGNAQLTMCILHHCTTLY